jgi:hypothetical protein
MGDTEGKILIAALTLFQFEAVVTPGNERLVHHMELFHCVADAEAEMPDYRGPCDGPHRPPKTQVCKKVMAAWAMGATPFFFPKVLSSDCRKSGLNLVISSHSGQYKVQDDNE